MIAGPKEAVPEPNNELPLHERIIHRLMDVLLGTDELLQMIELDPAASTRGIEGNIRRALEEMDKAVHSVCS